MKVLQESGIAIWEYLDGKKTMIGAAIVFLAGGLKAIEKIDQDTFETMIAVGGSIAIYGVRFAIEKAVTKKKK